MMVWKDEDYFNSFLLNSGKWEGQNWNAIGIAIVENYVTAWFGQVADPEGEAVVCGTRVEKQVRQDTVKPKVPVKKPASPKVKQPVQDSVKALKKELTAQPAVKPQNSPPPTADSSSVRNSDKRWFIIVKTNVSPEAARKFAEDLKFRF